MERKACNWLELSAIEYLRYLETLDSEALRRILIHEPLKLSFIREEKLVKVTWANSIYKKLPHTFQTTFIT
jgi:hypothetical protein